jgi:hypothetical protein
MNLGGTQRHRSWGHAFTSPRMEEEQTGVVTRRGRAASTPSGRKLGRRPTEIRDASMTPTAS